MTYEIKNDKKKKQKKKTKQVVGEKGESINKKHFLKFDSVI